MDIFESIGIIKLDYEYDVSSLQYFQNEIGKMIDNGKLTRNDIIKLLCNVLPNFHHIEKNLHLDNHL